ncbi:putative GINS complex, subunit Psf1 protein [Helianthus annuus]|nr:putative GINS complex, subunit Psf1 protein [Helianthus annuus]
MNIDMVPPKDPYIKVRVLEEIGEVLLSDQIANLAMHSILFLKRIDAESFISQVFL